MKQCQNKLNNECIIWCKYFNEPNDIKYYHILNGHFNEKINTLKQIKSNNGRREEEKLTSGPVTC